MLSEQEISTECPYCQSPISFLCEILEGPQSYIEDCEVCCKPIQLSFETDEEVGIKSLTVSRLND